MFPPKDELVSSVEAILAEYVEQERDMVLVGHDVQSDIKYFISLGYAIQSVPGMGEEVDTQRLHQAWKELSNGPGLSSTLVDLGIEYRSLHNAGNDAVYTLQAMLGIAVEAAPKSA